MCNLSSALSYIPKSMFISLLLMMLWRYWFCSNSCPVVFMTEKKKDTVKCSKISTHFFLFLKNAYKCSCSPRTSVVEVVPEHLYMSRLMTKPTKWLCAQPRLRSVLASALSDQNLSSCGQRRLWSDWVDGQADLSLRWAHMPFVGFVMRRLIKQWWTVWDRILS